MEFYTLASSSSGNAALLRHEQTLLLLDAGISARRIAQAMAELGFSPADLDAVLVTHEHRDHVAGLATLTKKYAVPVYASRGTAGCLPCSVEVLRPFSVGDSFSVGSFSIRSFRTSHDAADTVDYRIDSPDGSFGALTDTGYVTEEAVDALTGVDALLLESNHDIDMLKEGPYPYYLKQRILSNHGHLSNGAAAEFARHCAMHGTRDILLAHLSAENNLPSLALSTVKAHLAEAGFVSCPLNTEPERGQVAIGVAMPAVPVLMRL